MQRRTFLNTTLAAGGLATIPAAISSAADEQAKPVRQLLELRTYLLKDGKRTAFDAFASKALIPAERIERAILLIRGQKVLLDSDLAALYEKDEGRRVDDPFEECDGWVAAPIPDEWRHQAFPAFDVAVAGLRVEPRAIGTASILDHDQHRRLGKVEGLGGSGAYAGECAGRGGRQGHEEPASR